MLEPSEIGAAATRIYRLRVIHPTDSVAQVAARAGVAPDEAARAEEQLADLGLLRPSPGGGWVAISPESAADELLAPLEQDILQRRIAMAATRARLHALSGDYLEARSLRSAKTNIEVIKGIDSIRAVIDDLTRTCSSSLDTLAPGGGQSEQAIRSAVPLDLEMLARGVELRTIFQHSARRHLPTAQFVARITAAGARVRSSSTLPSRVQIYDRVCAVLPIDPENTGAGVALVRDPAVLGFVRRLFEYYWERSVNFSEVDRVAGPAPTGLERDVLLLMATGKKNQVIAHQLGMSDRSVSRIVSTLMERLDADSRFQAGVKAVQNGWLT
ncbi:LuxR C-terminal-related transcriptional regulator [Streptomyces sp. ST2-7A]|uniref:helix-turn-helix transcriptional regulator n=1 Tax=Streptomyces sp. ST2-7A TaxID=2907214 RepID=UPI001F1BE963|nr:LuxR C-terminal-related transcriptional regulator [Streptomyces sp. ST2-7A]MCE7082413.1 LuxR C-terminal-related transcriptional regulator [Streptomyces sp. ST2-7A]